MISRSITYGCNVHIICSLENIVGGVVVGLILYVRCSNERAWFRRINISIRHVSQFYEYIIVIVGCVRHRRAGISSHEIIIESVMSCTAHGAVSSTNCFEFFTHEIFFILFWRVTTRHKRDRANGYQWDINLTLSHTIPILNALLKNCSVESACRAEVNVKQP
jgi:hypothetical protein